MTLNIQHATLNAFYEAHKNVEAAHKEFRGPYQVTIVKGDTVKIELCLSGSIKIATATWDPRLGRDKSFVLETDGSILFSAIEELVAYAKSKVGPDVEINATAEFVSILYEYQRIQNAAYHLVKD